MGKRVCRHYVQVEDSAQTWAIVRETRQFMQNVGNDASNRCLCVSLACPILTRHRIISVIRDTLFKEAHGVGLPSIIRYLFLNGTLDHSMSHLFRTAFIITG